MSQLGKFVKLVQDKGSRIAVRRSIAHICEQSGFANLYRSSVRPKLSIKKDHQIKNGIPVAGGTIRWLDDIVPFETPSLKPNFKQTNISQLRDNVSTGDLVGIIGAGFGVTTVVASKETTSEGRVIAYDGNEERVDIARETVSINDCSEIASIEHMLVGTGFGDIEFDGASHIAPKTSPRSMYWKWIVKVLSMK